MSDGPHKSLPMRKGWRKLSERGANSAFDLEHIVEAIPDALGEDWHEERCDDLVSEMRVALNDERQGSLFAQQREDKIAALKKISGSGYPLRRQVLECVTQEFESGRDGADAIKRGTERALAEKLSRATLQVEEHFRRSNDESADRVRRNLQSAATQAPLGDVANRLLKTGGSTSTPPASPKRDGLDDGVPLP